MAAAVQETYLYGEYLNLEATELRLGLPDHTPSTSAITIKSGNKRSRTSSEMLSTAYSSSSSSSSSTALPSSKTQIVGWPPVRSYRKNNTLIKSKGAYIKVDMDGAAYLRKIDLKAYSSYEEMITVIEGLFKVAMRDDYIPTYQDKDGDWMLAGDVPWEMFIESCKRVRVMKSADAKGMMKYL